MGINSIEDTLTLSLTKQHLMVDIDDDDELIENYLIASRNFVQHYLGKNVATFECTESFLWWANPMTLEWEEEIRSAVIEYIDDDGDSQTLPVRVYAHNAIRENEPDDYNGGNITVTYTPYEYSFETPIYNQLRLLWIGEAYLNREINLVGSQVHNLKGWDVLAASVKTGRI